MPILPAIGGGPIAITRSEELAAVSSPPTYSDEAKQAVLAAMDAPDSDAVTVAFEREFAAYLGVRYALAACSGSAALHSACVAVGVGPGDEVITSAYAWPAQVGPILALQALPVFCDVDPNSACIVPDAIRRNITSRTKAILVFHPFGAVAPMDEISEIGREQGLPVIEDCSHAVGAKYRGRKAGALGDIACFRFGAGSLMNVLEGGALVTNNTRYYERACLFGTEYRLHPLASAIARTLLRHLEEQSAARSANMGYLTRRIAEVGRGIFEPPYDSPEMERVWPYFLCRFHAEYSGFPRQTLIEAFCAEGLPARGEPEGYLPVSLNPLYRESVEMGTAGESNGSPAASRRIEYEPGRFPASELFRKQCVAFPVLHRPASRELLEEIVAAVEKMILNLVVLQRRAYPPQPPHRSAPSVDPIAAEDVRFKPPVPLTVTAEQITDEGGWQHTGGIGRSCWGYHQSNIVRHGADVYALVWRDDEHLRVFHRRDGGAWEASPLLPPSPQSGVLLVDAAGRAHVIAGERACLHILFDAPGRVDSFHVEPLPFADTRFGAAIAANDDIFIAGGVPAMSWHRLDSTRDWAVAQSGRVPHETNRGYYLTAFDGRAAQTYCGEIHFVEEAGFLTLRTYHYHNPDLPAYPEDWQLKVISDLSPTWNGPARGATGQEDLFIDRKGRVHLLFWANPVPATGAWAARNSAYDLLYHLVGPAEGPFACYRLGHFSRGRLGQTADGRMHYLLTRQIEGGAGVWHAESAEDVFDTMREPARVDLPLPMDHFFVNTPRAGGTLSDTLDLYFTGGGSGGTKHIWYANLRL